MHTHFAYHTNLFATVQGNSTAAADTFHCLCPWEFDTKHHNDSNTQKWIWYVVSMSRVIFTEHSANWQREWEKCFESMSIDCFWWCNEDTEQRVDIFIWDSSNSIYSFFSLLFSSLLFDRLFMGRANLFLFLTHTHAKLLFFPCTITEKSVHHTHRANAASHYINPNHRNVTRWSNHPNWLSIGIELWLN